MSIPAHIDAKAGTRGLRAAVIVCSVVAVLALVAVIVGLLNVTAPFGPPLVFVSLVVMVAAFVLLPIFSSMRRTRIFAFLASQPGYVPGPRRFSVGATVTSMVAMGVEALAGVALVGLGVFQVRQGGESSGFGWIFVLLGVLMIAFGVGYMVYAAYLLGRQKGRDG